MCAAPLGLLRTPWLWLLLGVLVGEFFLFDHFGARRFTPIYPRWNDQIQYLGESYAGYEYARAHGLASGLWRALVNPSAQGTLHDVAAILAFTIAGPSRAAALALNFLALAGWQLALFLAVVRASARPALAFAAALLPIALLGPWQDIPGSAYDFRLDHLAMCALGISACAAWLSDGFRSRAGSLAFGIATGLTLLTRFLTGTYFAVVFFGALVWICCAADRKQRLLNLGFAALAAALIAAPIFWLNLDAIRDYYWFGHYIGPESVIRDPRLGVGRSISFVATQLVERHLGALFLIGAAVAATVLAFLRRQPAPATSSRHHWLPGTLFLLAPALILTLHRQKSEVVVSALVPGVIALVTAVWIHLARRASDAQLRAFAALWAVTALAFFAHKQLRPSVDPATLADTRRVASLADEIYRRSRAAPLNEIRVAVDYITDSLDGQVLRVICYERHRVWANIRMTLPTGIAEPDEPTVQSRLADSDFVFLTQQAPDGPYPFDRKLAALRPQLRAWCDAHLRVANEFTLSGRSMRLYQRREIPFP